MKSNTLVIYPSKSYLQTPCVRTLVCHLASQSHVTLITFSNDDEIHGDVKCLVTVRKANTLSGVSFVALIFFCLSLIKAIMYNRYRKVIFVGDVALLFAPFLFLQSCRDLVYQNLELYFPEDYSSKFRFIISNRLLRFLLRKSTMVVHHDHNRRRLFECLIGQKNPHIILPNIPHNYSHQLTKLKLKHAKYVDPDKEQLKVIYSGSLSAAWAGTANIIQYCEKNNLFLYLNSRLDELQLGSDLDSESIKLSSNLSPVEYQALIEKCQIGLVFYDVQLSRNIKYVGFSSGKCFQYLFSGLSIVINQVPLLTRSLVQKSLACDLSLSGDSLYDFYRATFKHDNTVMFLSNMCAAVDAELKKL